MKCPAATGQLTSTESPTSKNLARPEAEFASSASIFWPPPRVDDVHGHVTHVEQIGHGAAVVVVLRLRWRFGCDADLLGTQRDGSRPARGERRVRRDPHRSQAGDIHGDDALGVGSDRSREQVALADEVGDEPRPRKAVDSRRLVQLLDAAGVHHRDPMRQRERFGLVVRHVDERDADLLLQIDELDLHVLAELRVERRERLVQQQHRRMGDQRPRDRHALLLPARKLVRVALAEAGQPHVRERLGQLARNLARGRLRHLQRKGDVALHGHVREQCVALEYGAHRAALGRPVGDVAAVQQNAPAVGKIEAGDHPQERRLAAAGRS